MASISDIIEQFILNYLNSSDNIELSRNDMAKHFSCVPSQINYVLNTRFTLNRGYYIESVRGGAGYIKIIRMGNNNDRYLEELFNSIDNQINFAQGCYILDNLADKNYLSPNESSLIKKTISTKSLINPINIENSLRANILKELIIEMMKGENL